MTNETTAVDLEALARAIRAECRRLGVTPQQYLALVEQLRRDDSDARPLEARRSVVRRP